MAAPVEIPAAPPPQAVPDIEQSQLMQNYDPVGAMNGLFAPGYIGASKTSRDAVNAWNAQNRSMTNQLVDELRMPNGPQQSGGTASIPYGGSMSMNQSFLDPKGTVDPEALRVLAQGGKYNYGGRRDAIAAKVLANQQAATATPAVADPNKIPDWYWPQRQYEETTHGYNHGW